MQLSKAILDLHWETSSYKMIIQEVMFKNICESFWNRCLGWPYEFDSG